MSRSPRQHARGFTLTELMVALAVGLILSAVTGGLYVSAKKNFRVQDGLSRVEENARYAIHQVSKDIRMAGYRGCLSNQDAARKPITSALTAANQAAYAYSFDTGIQGYRAIGTGWTPSLDPALSALSPAPATGTDVLTIRMATGNTAFLAGAMASTTADVSVNLPATGAVANGDVVMISDCVAAAVFQITTLTAGTPATLVHAASGLNGTTNLGRAFNTDAVVMGMQTVSYYVGTSSVAPTGTETSLWRVAGTGAPEELAEGVSGLRIQFGEDTDGDFYANKYASADNVGNMNNVVAVRMDMLLRTGENNLSSKANASYRFNGTSTSASDRRLYRPYSTTIMMRNRSL